MNKTTQKKKKSLIGIGFFFIMISIYALLFVSNSSLFYQAIHYVEKIVITIIPILFIVFFIMSISHYLLKPKTVSKYLGAKARWKGWILSTLFGIFSHGSIYMWYPLLKQLQQKGMSYGFIAVFLYNRAVKIPLLPVLIFYFGLTYTIFLLVWMIFAGLLEGKIVDFLMTYSSSIS